MTLNLAPYPTAVEDVTAEAIAQHLAVVSQRRHVALYGFGTYVGDRLRPGWDHPAELAICEQALRRHDSCPDPLSNIRGYVAARMAEGEMTQNEADATTMRTIATQLRKVIQ